MKYSNLVLLPLVLFFCSCKKDKESVSWNSKVLTPILKSKLSIGNMVADSLYKLENDSTLTLSYDQNLKSLKIDSLVPFDGEEYSESVKISEFPLTTRDISDTLTGNDMTKGLSPIQLFLIKSIAGKPSVIPPFNNIVSPPDTIKADSIFTSADIIKGSLKITVINNFPVALTNVTYSLKNLSNGFLIGTGVFNRIEPNGIPAIDSIKLDGKVIDGSFIYQVTNFNIEGSNGQQVTLDLNKGIIFKIEAKDLKAKTMTAIFPEQQFIQNPFETKLEGVGDKKLTKVKIKSGMVKLDYISTSPDTVHFNYKILDAIQNADTFRFAGKFNPAVNGIATTGTIYKDVKDFELDLMLEGSTGGVQYNTFRSFLSAGFEFTGKQVTITENDSIIIKIKLVDIVPSYASGYFGKDTFKVTPDPVIFEAFKNFKEGALSFENVNLSLNVSSGAGVESKVVIDKIEGLNSTRNTRKTLSINQPYFSIPAAIETPFTKQTVSYQINVNNSSVRAFLENMPDKLFCEGTVITNPSADASVDPTTLNNFLNENSSFDISLSLDIPLSFNANNLTLADTTYLSKFDLKNIDKIKDATISLLLDNELPLSFKINMYVYDADNKLVDSLVSITPVAAAITNPANGKLVTSQKKQLDYYFDNQRLRTLLESKKVYFKAVMNSPTTDFYKINAGNELKVNIVGRFNYTMGVN